SWLVSIMGLGTVSGTGSQRQAQAEEADATLAKVIAARPTRSLIIVAGVADTDTTSRLHVAFAEGPGWDGGWLTSAGTGRDGYLQLIDISPTGVVALAPPAPHT